jgi:N-acetyl-alpha-D-muramate 1-phosphate uridylyltransferase
MQPVPHPLLIFAAGFGTRMGGLTATRPKPLIQVAGRPLIDHALAVAAEAGVTRTVVNVHYLADQIIDHLRGRDVQISHEQGQILETGGGLRAAFSLLGSDLVMTLNSDAVWTGANPLAQLADAWDDAKMDALLLLLPLAKAREHGPKADFRLAADDRISRGCGDEGHVYLGASMIRTDRMFGIPDDSFSLNRPWNDIIADGRAFGVVHDGGWCDVGTPAGIAQAETLLQSSTND